jgi:hypothetical protein
LERGPGGPVGPGGPGGPGELAKGQKCSIIVLLPLKLAYSLIYILFI